MSLITNRHEEQPPFEVGFGEHVANALIGMAFLLPKNENGEHLRATITKEIIETSQQL